MHPLRRHLLLTLAASALPSNRAFARPAASPEPLLANVFGAHIDPAAYLVSEKFDGVRGLWDGQALRFRSGRTVPAPRWFTERLPRQPLDGELWLGRRRFDEVSGLVRAQTPDDAAWRELRYMVFELPGAEGTFAERAARLATLAQDTGWSQMVAAPQSAIADRESLRLRLAQTVAQGGEGLMLHLASAPSSSGRSDVLVKLKPHLDAEATVVAHHPGRGKYEGLLGALEVRTPEGRRFLVGSGLSDAQRRAPPAIGSVVTYRYRDLTNTGLPRFASFMRLHEAH
ncbi:MAG: DNA ligase [Burkholderiaceae bacterium]